MKNMVRALFLLLAIALFAVACFNPWDGNAELGAVTISLYASPSARAVWGVTIPTTLTHDITLKRNGSTIATKTIGAGVTTAQIEVSPGPVDIEVLAKYNGWDFAKGSSASSVNVVAGQTTQAAAIEMQRMDSGVVLSIEMGGTVDFGAMFPVATTATKYVDITNYSESPANLTFNVNGDTSIFFPAGLAPMTLTKDTNQRINMTPVGLTAPSGDFAVRSVTVEISDGTTTTLAFNVEVTVCNYTSGGIQKMVEKAASGDTITLPGGTYQMNSTVNIDKDLNIKTGSGTILSRVGTYLGNFLNISAGSVFIGDTTGTIDLKLRGDQGATAPTDSMITVTGGSLVLSSNVVLSNNTVDTSVRTDRGGAISVLGGNLTLQGYVTIENNMAEYGGGVYINSGATFSKTGNTVIYGSGPPSNTPSGSENKAGGGGLNKGDAVWYAFSPGYYRDTTASPVVDLSTGDLTTNWNQ